MWIHTRDCVAIVNAIHHRRCIYRWVSTIRVVTSVLILGERFSVVTVKMVLLRWSAAFIEGGYTRGEDAPSTATDFGCGCSIMMMAGGLGSDGRRGTSRRLTRDPPRTPHLWWTRTGCREVYRKLIRMAPNVWDQRSREREHVGQLSRHVFRIKCTEWCLAAAKRTCGGCVLRGERHVGVSEETGTSCRGSSCS